MLLLCSRCGSVRSTQPYRSNKEVKVVCITCKDKRPIMHVRVEPRSPSKPKLRMFDLARGKLHGQMS